MKNVIITIWFLVTCSISFSQEISINDNPMRKSNSIGLEYDLFYRLMRNNYSLNNIIYPQYQLALSYSKYLWGNNLIHGVFDFGLGTTKVTYGFDHQTQQWLTHNSLYIPADISLLLGKKNNFFSNSVGVFYSGKRIANVQLSDVYYENLEDVFFLKHTVYIHYSMGYKCIVKKRFIINLSIVSGKRDIFHYDLKYTNKRNLQTCYPNYQIKIEYLIN